MKAVPLTLVLGLSCVAIAAAAEPVEIREGVLFEKNVSIPTDDGAFMMSNVFRPAAEGRYPVLISMSIYGKDIHTRDFNPEVWEEMVAHIPGLCERSSCEYHTWETPDPEVWVSGWLRGDPHRCARVRESRRGSSIPSRRARSATSTTPSSGRGPSPGAMARSASRESPTSRWSSGVRLRCVRRTWRPSHPGRALTRPTGTCCATAGF